MTQSTKESPTIPTTDSHLLDTKVLLGSKLAALDGDIGRIRDFYFDDDIWVVRYAIADTTSWLPGRLVLLSPHAFGKLDQREKTLNINLRKLQIQDSPSIESHKPVSRQYEVDYFRHYGWPAYWAGDALWGMGGLPVVVPPAQDDIQAQETYHHRDDKHLQSMGDVTGYRIKAVDGEMGYVSSFLVDDRSWAIREIVVEAGHWYSGRKVRIPISQVERISYRDARVNVTLTKVEIEKIADHELTPGGQGPAKEEVMQMLEENAGKMEAQLRNWGVKLDKVFAKAEAAGNAVKSDYRKDAEDLKAKYKVAQSKFDECKAAGSAKWGILKTGLETAWNDLEAAFKKLGKSSAQAEQAQPSKPEPPQGPA